jgi:hypothetical protein
MAVLERRDAWQAKRPFVDQARGDGTRGSVPTVAWPAAV